MMVHEIDVILQEDLFGAWGSDGRFYCGDCCTEAEVEIHRDDILTTQAVQGSGAFYYCCVCVERIQPDQH
ncbi:unnamed protein product [marine sediment metagenome]|uniref:Uncharacterized protein n=1 Tax=marine sediment metagenome TaxID=412755 RepID=X0SNJ6_9ZZZZ